MKIVFLIALGVGFAASSFNQGYVGSGFFFTTLSAGLLISTIVHYLDNSPGARHD